MPIMTDGGGGGTFEKAPEGMHVARCARIIQLGTHHNKFYDKQQSMVLIQWELPMALISTGDFAGMPFLVSQRYTLSHHENSRLRQDLEGWYGKTFDTVALDAAGGFDLERLVGRPALLNIQHSQDGKFSNIKTVNPVMPGTTVPDPITTTLVFSLADATPAIWEEMTDGLKDKIKESREWAALQTRLGLQGAPAQQQPSADVPYQQPHHQAPHHQQQPQQQVPQQQQAAPAISQPQPYQQPHHQAPHHQQQPQQQVPQQQQAAPAISQPQPYRPPQHHQAPHHQQQPQQELPPAQDAPGGYQVDPNDHTTF